MLAIEMEVVLCATDTFLASLWKTARSRVTTTGSEGRGTGIGWPRRLTGRAGWPWK